MSAHPDKIQQSLREEVAKQDTLIAALADLIEAHQLGYEPIPIELVKKTDVYRVLDKYLKDNDDFDKISKEIEEITRDY